MMRIMCCVYQCNMHFWSPFYVYCSVCQCEIFKSRSIFIVLMTKALWLFWTTLQ